MVLSNKSKHHHIANVICCKNLDVNWVKVKSHSGVLGNKHADTFAEAAAFSNMHLSHMIDEHFLRTGSTAVSVWHSDFYLAAGFTNTQTAGFQTYFMKALNVEVLDYVFFCPYDAAGCVWLTCISNVVVGAALCKSFVFKEWYHESVAVFKDPKVVA
ncbi:hypothetical protein G9A89_004663 [Geosiphon pyriformis]|nr:hypothetical protein G9A89_004663 [Geosiphon pyriformis]